MKNTYGYKNKPATHIRKGDTLVFVSPVSEKARKHLVSKVKENDENSVIVTFPQIKDDKGHVVEERASLLLANNEQVTFEEDV